MITIYFPDGSSKKVTAVEGQQLVTAGKASYKPYEINLVPEGYSKESSILYTDPVEEDINKFNDKENSTSENFGGPEEEAYSFND